MPNPENLKPAKKGDVRNPKGRGNSPGRATILKKWLEVQAKLKNPITGKIEKGVVEDKVILALISKALKGDVRAIQEIMDTKYGKILQKSEIKGEGKVQVYRMPDGTKIEF